MSDPIIGHTIPQRLPIYRNTHPHRSMAVRAYKMYIKCAHVCRECHLKWTHRMGIVENCKLEIYSICEACMCWPQSDNETKIAAMPIHWRKHQASRYPNTVKASK